MRWRLAKKVLWLDGKVTCACYSREGNTMPGHAPGCRGRGGQPRRQSAYHRLARRHMKRWWREFEEATGLNALR